jgi:hypothetical protein
MREDGSDVGGRMWRIINVVGSRCSEFPFAKGTEIEIYGYF